MLCDKCKKNEATIVRQTTVNGVTHTEHLCSDCAAKESDNMFGSFFNNDFFNDPFLGGNPIANWFAPLFEGATVQTPQKKEVGPGPCPHCGMTWEEFQKNGLLGCGECYDDFSEVLHELLRRIHGKSEHVGKTPFRGSTEVKEKRPQNERERLEAAMKKAVQEENFEEAARIRDKIKALVRKEGTESGKGGDTDVNS